MFYVYYVTPKVFNSDYFPTMTLPNVKRKRKGIIRDSFLLESTQDTFHHMSITLRVVDETGPYFSTIRRSFRGLAVAYSAARGLSEPRH